ncbi:hypothetical protein [Smaragdicoccus niigatensis]|uniref:hypothetical protein n=1 Tax=Smaragdicoccus niigatensis TaxID=359359 RepID=UPI00037EFCD7|nr:hypothetical protein [Smaragdicoccus niigatensis]
MTHTQPGTGAEDTREQEQARQFHGTLVEQLRITGHQLKSARSAARRGAAAAHFRVGKLNRDVNELRHLISLLHDRFPTLASPDDKI